MLEIFVDDNGVRGGGFKTSIGKTLRRIANKTKAFGRRVAGKAKEKAKEKLDEAKEQLLDPDDEPEDSVLPGMPMERRPLGDSYFYAPNEARARPVLDRIYGEAWRRHPVRRCCWPECSSSEC